MYKITNVSQKSLSLSDLAEQSGLEPRTIRSYIERGLLAGAEGRGPKAAYSAEHLARLKAIQRIRDLRRDLTLDEIRRQLQQFSPAQIRALAAEEGASLTALQPEAPQSALAYLRSLRSHQTGDDRVLYCEMPLLDAQEDSEAGNTESNLLDISDELALSYLAPESDQQTTVEQAVQLLERITGPQTVPRTVQERTWHRIEITPDIELSVRAGFQPEQLAQFQRLGDLLRHLLTRGTS